MNDPIRIKASDELGNIAYIHRESGERFRCTLANGTPAAMSYAGITGDEMAARFALDACATGDQAMAVLRRFGSRPFRYEFVTPITQAERMQEPPLLFLRLYHGRLDPAENLDDWGSEGPVIGPLAFVQTTYMCDVKFAAAPEVMERFFPTVIAEWRERGFANAAGPLCDWHFTVDGDLIEYDGIYYGDWTVFQATLSEVEAERRTTDQPE